jgi:hypothetical protein
MPSKGRHTTRRHRPHLKKPYNHIDINKPMGVICIQAQRKERQKENIDLFFSDTTRKKS